MESIVVKFKKMEDDAMLPVGHHATDAGWDLHSAENVTFSDRCIVSTGVAMDIPSGCFGEIKDRSSMASKGIITAGGVIDSGYHGTVKIILINLSGEDYVIRKGQRVAQIIFHQIPRVYAEEVEEFDESERGDKGFGSTGMFETIEKGKWVRIPAKGPDGIKGKVHMSYYIKMIKKHPSLLDQAKEQHPEYMSEWEKIEREL